MTKSAIEQAADEINAALARLTAEQARVPPDREALAMECEAEAAHQYTSGRVSRQLTAIATALRIPAPAECEEMANELTAPCWETGGVIPYETGVRAAALLRRLAPAEGWRPIERAPKDGTCIIGLHRGGEAARISWGQSRQNELTWCSTERSYITSAFLLWMPCPNIPSPPAEEEKT